MITIEEFIKHYNQNVDWNLEIRSKLDVETIKSYPVTEDMLDDYLSTEKLTEEDYEWENAQLYKLDNHAPDDKCIYELQVYDFNVYSTMNFWCNPGITKEEYIKNRIDIISKEVTKSIKIHQRNIHALERELHCMNTLLQGLNN